jgi:hypothetical protein
MDSVTKQFKTKCFQSSNVPRGRKCSALGECAPGLACVDAACKAYCNGANGECTTGVGAACAGVQYDPGDGGAVPIQGLMVCSDQCDLMNPSAVCGPGVTCLPHSEPTTKPGQSGCLGGAGTGTSNCQTHTDCAPGYACANAKCHKWCSSSLDCTGGQTCQQLTSGGKTGWFYVGNKQFGMCF